MGTGIAACTRERGDVPHHFVDPHPGPEYPVPDEFARLVLGLEGAMGCPVWLLCQKGNPERHDSLGESIPDVFLAARRALGRAQHVALLVDSPGGQAKHAYRTALVLGKHGGFTAVVPRFAKSAATLLSLGAKEIILGEYAELGPLDVQIDDPDRERFVSALDEVQALERLQAASMAAIDQAMFLLVPRTRKRTDVLLPMVLTFVSEMMRPLLDKIDAVHYTEVSRWLKEGEEYAVRCLLSADYPESRAKDIAAHLVNGYPVHDFLIEAGEAEAVGLRVAHPAPEIAQLVEAMVPFLRSMSAVGVMKEVGRHDESEDEGQQGEGDDA